MNENQEVPVRQEKERSTSKTVFAGKTKWIALAVAGLLLVGGGTGAWAYAEAKADREATAAYEVALESTRSQESDAKSELLAAHTDAVEAQAERISDLEALFENSADEVKDEDARQALREVLDELIEITTVEPVLEVQKVIVSHERDAKNYPAVEFSIADAVVPSVADIQAAGAAAEQAGDAVADAVDAFFADKLTQQVAASEKTFKESAQADQKLRDALEKAVKDAKSGEITGKADVTAEIKTLKDATKNVADSHEKAVKEAEAKAQAQAEEQAQARRQAQQAAANSSSQPSRPAATTGGSSSQGSGKSNTSSKPAAPAPKPKPTTAAPKPKPTTAAPKPKPTTTAPKPKQTTAAPKPPAPAPKPTTPPAPKPKPTQPPAPTVVNEWGGPNTFKGASECSLARYGWADSVASARGSALMGIGAAQVYHLSGTTDSVDFKIYTCPK